MIVRRLNISPFVWLVLLTFLWQTTAMASSYANVTLTSPNGDMSVVVYLPIGIKPNERTYYFSSRFEHGSMIGSIRRKSRTPRNDGSARVDVHSHTLYDAEMWRLPHNSNWPESGLGLAAEFGVGDDGDFCSYRCGWTGSGDITNGVLEYREAMIGEPFLKIGVGELIKGSCPNCDSAEDYKFNSPYQFAKLPVWSMTYEEGSSTVHLEHEARLRESGYKLQKQITLNGETLTVTSTLENLGNKPFTTAWYSHNFFTCDGIAVGPGYEVDLNLRGDRSTSRLYEEPGTWSWTEPLLDYATLSKRPESIGIMMNRALDPGIRIKTEFVNDGTTDGGFTLRACGTTIESSMYPIRDRSASDIAMYAYNLYIERGTMSAEPQILLHLEPGASKTWTHQLVFSDMASAAQIPSRLSELQQQSLAATVFDSSLVLQRTNGQALVLLGSLLLLTYFTLVVFGASQRAYRQYRHRREYSRIGDDIDDSQT
jgi:hypothetical protein